MLLVLGFVIFGAAIGGLKAKRGKGTTADKLHYIVTYGVIFAILGVIVQVILMRSTM